MRRPLRVLIPATALLGGALACSGVPQDSLPPTGPAPSPVPEPEPVAPAPAPENPLVLGAKYWFDSDAAPKPIWELDETLIFRKDGTCTLLWESTYDCTWEAKAAGDRWTVEITGFTGARDPDGNPHEPSDAQPGARYAVSADGQRLEGVGREDGKDFVLTERDEKRGKGGKAKGGKSPR